MQFLRYSLLIIPLVIIIFFGFIILNENNAKEFVPIEMTKFSSTTLDNKNIKNSDLPDTYFLNVWASWCITCMVEHPYLSKLSNNGIKIVGLNYKDDRSDALAWLNKFDNPYDLIIHDFKGTLALDLGVTGAPETFLVNNGKVVAHYQGEVNQTVWNEVFQPIINSKNLSLK